MALDVGTTLDRRMAPYVPLARARNPVPPKGPM